MPNIPAWLEELFEFSGYATLPEGSTITVEGGQFVLVTPSTNAVVIDAGHSTTVNPDTVDAGDSAAVNADTIDAGST